MPSLADNLINVYDDLPDILIQRYHHDFKHVNPNKLDEHIYPLVKAFEKFGQTIIPIFSCTGHNQKPLSLSFTINKDNEHILNSLFEQMLTVNGIKIIHSGFGFDYKFSVYNRLGNRLQPLKKNEAGILFRLYTITLNYHRNIDLADLINGLKKVVDEFTQVIE